MIRQSLEAEAEKLLLDFEMSTRVLESKNRDATINPEARYLQQNERRKEARTALLKTIDRYVEERELLAKISALKKLLDHKGLTYDIFVLGTLSELKRELKALRQQVKEPS